jgi:hypothetical protein
MRPDPRPPPLHDWRTTDSDEIARRRQRARDEKPQVENRTPEHPVFSNFRVLSPSGSSYDVELRDVAERRFACTCVDFRTSGLGTCKHVEATLLHLEATHPAAFAAAQAGPAQSERAELVPDGNGQTLLVESGLDRLPARLRAAFDAEGRLRDASAAAVVTWGARRCDRRRARRAAKAAAAQIHRAASAGAVAGRACAVGDDRGTVFDRAATHRVHHHNAAADKAVGAAAAG